MSKSVALSVGILPMDRFTLSPMAAFLDILRLAADKGDRSQKRNCSWTVMAANKSMVTSSCGLDITVERLQHDPADFDYIAVFGGLLASDASLDSSTIAFLKKADELGIPLIGVCNGTYALLDAGLIRDETCCVSWFHHRDFVEAFGDRITLDSKQLFIEDGKRITCAGGVGAADLALWLVRRHLGDRWARKSQRIMIMEEARSSTRSQPLPALSAGVQDSQIRQTILNIEQRISEKLTTDQLAEAIGIGRRQLERKFRKEMNMGIHEFIRDMRLNLAYNMVTTSTTPVTNVAYECGFNSHAHFSALFREKFGVSPKKLREGRVRESDIMDADV